jgi:class 3 adenylate cyclase
MRNIHLNAIEQLRLTHASEAADELERRWGAVLTADIVEFSRLIHIDEENTYSLYKSHRRELLDPKLREYGARFVKSTGDGILAEFPSALDAARCAVDVQQSMAERCQGIARDSCIIFRIGLSWGRIMADLEDIYGHDVNIAARLQTIAPPGGIAMSGVFAGCIQGALPLQLEDMGEQHFHNMRYPVQVFRCQF